MKQVFATPEGGVEVDLTPEEQAEYDARLAAPPDPPPPPVPGLVASGRYTLVDGQVDNLSVVAGLPAACAVDVGTFWVFFYEPQPDLSYIVSPSSSEGRANVTTRTTEYFELCVKDDSGTPINPSEFSVSIVRTL